MKAPVGYDAIVAFYGDPGKLLREDGTVSPIWESNMVLVPMPGPLPLGWKKDVSARSVRVHKKIEDVTRETFSALSSTCWSRLRTYDGGYTWRLQRGPTVKLSMHAFGAALDFDEATNKLGKKGDMAAEVVAIFETFGWTWGGRWARKDYMHFQFGSGY